MTTHMTAKQKERAKAMFSRNGRAGCRTNCALGIARLVHMCTPGLFRHVHKRGNATVIWVVNDKDEFDELKH